MLFGAEPAIIGRMVDLTNSGTFAIEPDAEPIKSLEWLHSFAERYIAGWNSGDSGAVAACVTDDTVWRDPSMAELACGSAAVAQFVDETVQAFPDLNYTQPFAPVITDDSLLAILPWRMTGTHLGLLEPPGFAPTRKPIDLLVIDLWQFRSGLIWRSQSSWDLTEMLQQLGLIPARGSLAERAMARAQRARAKLPF